MKKCCLLAAISVCLLFSPSYQKESASRIYNGKVSMKLNGEFFFGDAHAVCKDGNSINHYYSMKTTDKSWERTFILSIAYVLSTTKRQVLQRRNPDKNSSPQNSLCIMDGNILYSYYELNELDSIEDFFQFDITADNISGTFEASFIIDSLSNLDSRSPNTIIIADGHFKTNLEQP